MQAGAALPTLELVESLQGADPKRPAHAIVNGENLAVLALFAARYEGAVDCMYIDPPYNSGARNWKYNNRFDDVLAESRHDAWLEFMRPRLRLAKALLKPDGVLVVTIDKNEHFYLGVLLEREFPAHDVTSICVVHNPRGAQGDNFSHVNEFALFVTPKGRRTIAEQALATPTLDHLRNWGGESRREDAKNCFYPIFVRDGRIAGFGDVPSDDVHPPHHAPREDGSTEIWPIDNAGHERKWRYARQSVEAIANRLSVKEVNGIPQIMLAKHARTHKTVWHGARYDANTYGTRLVKKLTGVDFPFPKSVLAVKDALYACTAHKPQALILDFFAGSGTTFHATCMLNREDGGSRRCILVTNNEGGIFDCVTVPRCKAVVLGRTAAGVALAGALDGQPLRDGYAENVDFARFIVN